MMMNEALIVIAFLALWIIETILTENEWFTWSTILLIAVGGICYYWNVWGVVFWIKSNLPLCFEFFVIYLVFGVAWSFIKWFSYLIKYREQWLKAIKEDESKKNNWEKASSHFYKPEAINNKERIIAWMAFWPFSLLGTLINDPIRRLFHFAFSTFKKLYQKISDYVFSDKVFEDLEKK